jgi:predicted amidohydrolase
VEKTHQYILAAAEAGSRLVVFPEANLTGYYFPYVVTLSEREVEAALVEIYRLAVQQCLWVIVGSIRKTGDRYLNLAHVISPEGRVVHEYAKINLAGVDEKAYCRGGNKLSLFSIDGVLCTLVICRDGRHPELYRIPAMAGAQILFQPSCSSDEIGAVWWKRVSGRAQQPAGPNSRIFHCVANTIGQSPDGKQSSSGGSFIRDPDGLPLAEAGFYHEEIITAVLDISRADRSYALDSLYNPPFLSQYWRAMIEEAKARADQKPSASLGEQS